MDAAPATVPYAGHFSVDESFLEFTFAVMKYAPRASMRKFVANLLPEVLTILLLSLCPVLIFANGAPGGTIVVWGDNSYGQMNVPTNLTGVRAIAAGGYHTVALKTDGTVVAWGDNLSGETNVPTGLSGVTAIAAGGGHSVALKSDGTVVAWGSNFYGQTNVPVGLGGVTALAAGYGHTVALKSDGTVVAWGNNGNGEASVPAGLSGVIAIAAGSYHTLALKNDGTVVAWGAGTTSTTGVDYGQSIIPPGLSGVVAIAGGGLHSVALKSDGTVVAWGYNASGQITIPPGLSGVSAIAAGNAHTVALKTDGTVVTWGANNYGQRNVPTGLSGVTAITSGDYHVAALVPSGFYPAITTQPVGQTFASGGTVTMNVTATGTGLSYQWQLNGTNVIGATNASLTLTNLAAANAGAYQVVVRNAGGTIVTSQAANLVYFGDLHYCANMILAGPVGQQFRVDYADVVGSVTNWVTLTNVTLPYSPFVVLDLNSAGRTNRFYRGVPLP